MKNIAVFTGTRAEYSLLYWLLKYLQTSDDVNLQLYVGGTHLSHEFGYSYNQIIEDGFNVTEKLEFLLSSDSPTAVSKSLGLAVSAAADAIAKHAPDMIVVLGDRYEALGVVQAALIFKVPVVHIHGGEITEGAIDDAIRHAITKLSHLHFTSTEIYRQRVIQLGENPAHVFNVGAPGIDSIMQLELLTRSQLKEYFDGQLTKPYFLVTYHPETLLDSERSADIEQLLSALNQFESHQVIITYPNADSFGREIIARLKKYAQSRKWQVFLVKNLGQVRYLSAMKYAQVVIGNSSSGIIEAPSFNVPTVDIGNRQKGRVASDTVIHCQSQCDAIVQSITLALSDEFKVAIKDSINPYGTGNASKAIFEKIQSFEFENICHKKFFDINTQ